MFSGSLKQVGERHEPDDLGAADLLQTHQPQRAGRGELAHDGQQSIVGGACLHSSGGRGGGGGGALGEERAQWRVDSDGDLMG